MSGSLPILAPMRRYLLLLTLACSLLHTHAQGLEVSPARLHFRIGAGEVQQQTITVRNKSAARSIFTLSAGDWTLDPSGKMLRAAPGEATRSCSPWL
ncbi:MAG: hypothetical protein OHK0039_22990 [Bacteroidia bacterium]